MSDSDRRFVALIAMILVVIGGLNTFILGVWMRENAPACQPEQKGQS